jgi:predicted amidophosphoribosyltransferase
VCGEAGAAPCRRCVTRLRRAPVNQPPPAGLDVCRSLLVYEGASRRLVTGLKYRNHRAVLAWLSGRLAHLLVPPPGAVVTWAPTSSRRRRTRGFDQAELLARAVARRWRVPCRRLLVRTADTAQTGASIAERHAGPAFMPVRPLGSPTAPATPVVVVDDVTTTGSTLRAAARALRGAGATWVGAVTVARTPRHALEPEGPVRPVAPIESVPPLSYPSQDVNKTLKFAAESTEYGQ